MTQGQGADVVMRAVAAAMGGQFSEVPAQLEAVRHALDWGEDVTTLEAADCLAAAAALDWVCDRHPEHAAALGLDPLQVRALLRRATEALVGPLDAP